MVQYQHLMNFAQTGILKEIFCMSDPEEIEIPPKRRIPYSFSELEEFQSIIIKWINHVRLKNRTLKHLRLQNVSPLGINVNKRPCKGGLIHQGGSRMELLKKVFLKVCRK